MSKRWLLKPKYPQEFAEKLPGYNPVILQLLYDRGLDTHKKVDEFLNPDYTQDIYDPFLFNEMQKAVDRINKAVKNDEKILVYGDYDADGVTSTTLLVKTLEKINAKNIEIHIPHRHLDGYGMNKQAVQNFVDNGIKLVITVDCGITNIEQIELLKQNNIDTIVTDHHLQAKELPDAFAIINPSVETEKYPFKKLAGVGVAFKLAQALFKSQNDSEDYEAFEKWLLDVVTIGTIGDVAPILGENRTLVKYGLMVLNKTPRKGLRELIRVSSLSNGHDPSQEIPLGEDIYELNVRNVAWQIVPRINAAGRIDHANLAYTLLTTEDEMEAVALAQDIHQKNLERQKIAETMLTEAEELIGKVTDEDKILIIAKEGWLEGIVGLVAGKLKDRYNRPIILLNKDGENYSGSGRSISEFNITEALQECSELLDRFGGHAQACGLGLTGEKNFNGLKDKIKSIANEKLKGIELVPTIEIDVELKMEDLNWDLWDEIEKFEPFAEANPLPLFLIKNVKIEEMDIIGKNNNTLRFQLSQNNEKQKAISFGKVEEWGDKIKVGDNIDVVVEFGVNEWNGNRELQFKIIDWKK
ncbi:MAG: single-stranded-DNA-specific exonuclease RecJ [Patescibacteria group bacterium]